MPKTKPEMLFLTSWTKAMMWPKAWKRSPRICKLTKIPTYEEEALYRPVPSNPDPRNRHLEPSLRPRHLPSHLSWNWRARNGRLSTSKAIPIWLLKGPKPTSLFMCTDVKIPLWKSKAKSITLLWMGARSWRWFLTMLCLLVNSSIANLCKCRYVF